MTDQLTNTEQAFVDIVSKADFSGEELRVGMFKAIAFAASETGLTEPSESVLRVAAPHYTVKPDGNVNKARVSECRLWCLPAVRDSIKKIEKYADDNKLSGEHLRRRADRWLGLARLIKDGGKLTDKKARDAKLYKASVTEGIKSTEKLAEAMAIAACDRLRRSARDFGLDPKSADAKKLTKDGEPRKVLQQMIVESIVKSLNHPTNAVVLALATGGGAKPSAGEAEPESSEPEIQIPDGMDPALWAMLSPKKQRKFLKKKGIIS